MQLNLKNKGVLISLIALIIIVLDQVSKYLVIKFMNLWETIPVVDGFFNLVHVRNRGIAFGIMNKQGSESLYYLLIAFTVVAIVLILFWTIRLNPGAKSLILGFSFILGGAFGNLIDRVFRKEVIDFLDFYLKSYHWPAFNVADSAITVGTVLIVFNVFFMKAPLNKIETS